MNTDRDATRIVRSWMDEGVTQLPDRVLDAVLDQIPATPQRRVAWWPARRLQRMSAMLKYGLAAAVVVAAILIGVTTIGIGTSNVGGPGVEPPPTPQASTAEPPATPRALSTPERALPEGPFVLSAGEIDDGLRNLTITVTIPGPGWYGRPANGILGNVPEKEDFGPEDAWMIGPFVGDIYVPADPCRWSTTMPNTPATTVDGVVAALQGQASRDASAPVDITVDGHAATSITLHVPNDAAFVECDRTEFCTLSDSPTVCHRYHQFPGQIDELWIVDVNGEVAVIDATWSDETPAGARAELRAILESIEVETP